MRPTVEVPRIVIRYFREALEQTGLEQEWTPVMEALVEQTIFPRLKGLPLDHLQLPDPDLLAVAMALLRQRPDVAKPLVNLLATAMNVGVAATAHHGFVEVLGHLNTDEIRLLQHMKPGHNYPVEAVQLTQALEPSRRWNLLYAELVAEAGLAFAGSLRDYLKILRGLGLVHLDERVYGTLVSEADLSDEALLQRVTAIIGTGNAITLVDRQPLSLQLTRFGTMFCAVCLPANA
ncbi:MAG: Abi-alpha family protein [Bacteroidota bacterium]